MHFNDAPQVLQTRAELLCVHSQCDTEALILGWEVGDQAFIIQVSSSNSFSPGRTPEK